jgi:hypothetical protein
VFAAGFGADALITNSFRASYLQDSLAHPDGGFPTVTDGLPPAAPANPLRIAFKANDLRNWTPTAPVLLCGGHDDPTVLYMNTQLMERYWNSSGATASIRVLDVDDDPSIGDDEAALKLAFNTAKEALRVSGGDTAVFENYHAGLVAPFCLTAVQSFFDGF